MTSATVRIWRDCGFTEGTLEVPSKTSSLPSYQYSFSLPAVPREDLFNSFRVKHAYEDLYDCNYLQVTYDMNNGDDVTVYGWIDAVRCISDTAGSPNTLIEWHTDLWRTFLSRASFGAGVVTKRPASGTVPPQTYSNMTQLKTGDPIALMPSSETIMWAYCNLTTGTDTKTTTTYCWPVNPSQTEFQYTVVYLFKSGAAPSYTQTVTGAFDELLGVDPDAIYGCWLSPIAPAPATVVKQSDTKTTVTMLPWGLFVGASCTVFQYFAGSALGLLDHYPEQTTSVSAQTTDTEVFAVTDLDGMPVYSLPWGVPVTKSVVRTVNADTSMYITIRFINDSFSDNIDAGANGLTCSIPLKSIPMSSNAKSAYVYSGQQEYDRESMNIARNQALVSNITSLMTGTANNAVMASLGNSKTDQSGRYMLNSSGKPIPTGSGAVSTATKAGMSIPGASLLTMGTGIVGTEIDYFATGYFNDRTMDATMDYKAHQTSTLTLPGSGIDWILHGRVPMLVKLKWDSYSIAQRDSDIALYGISVREPTSDCTALINKGGPMRIQNLNVTGSIPPGAKHYFRERFAQGVRMI